MRHVSGQTDRHGAGRGAGCEAFTLTSCTKTASAALMIAGNVAPLDFVLRISDFLP
jgi:hypothetical protein